MASWTRLSAFNQRLDSLLQGIRTEDLLTADRDLAIRQAVQEYSQALPRRETLEFAGDGGSYYLLYGKVEDVDEGDRDASIDLTSSGADSKLGILFTLDYRMEIHQVNVWLSRVGATVAGEVQVTIYSTNSNLPVNPIVTSEAVDIDGIEGAPRGIFNRVRFPFAADQIIDLPAGTYAAVLESSGYTYASGTNEVNLGVDQSNVTNTVVTYNGTTWSAYGTASAGILEVVAAIPGWREKAGALVSVEYPAAEIANDEHPNILDEEDFYLFEAADGAWLYLSGATPAATEKVRLTYSRPYTWLEASDPLIDTPESHFDALCFLAASYACSMLAVRYGQKRESTINADSVERRTQADVYRSLAADFRKRYLALAGLDHGMDGKAAKPGSTLTEIDYAYEIGSDFLFHTRSRR